MHTSEGEAELGLVIGISSVKMRRRMVAIEHANDDSVEGAEPRNPALF